MALTTTTTLDDLFANIIAQARFTAEEQSLMAGLVTRYDIAGQAGKTIQVPKYPSITAEDLNEGTDMTGTAVSTSSVEITVAEVGAQVVLTDMAAFGAGNPAAELGTVLGSSIATKMDKDLIALFSGFSAQMGATGTVLTADSLFRAVATLRAANATGSLSAVISPIQAYQLKGDLTNQFQNPAGGETQNIAMVNSYVGQLAGVTIYESSNIDGSGTDAIGCVFAPEALALAMKRDFVIENQRDASLRAWELNATAIYGVGELDNAYGAGLLSAAAFA